MQIAFIHNRNRAFQRLFCLALALAASQLFSCSTPVPPPTLTAEQRTQRENAAGIELASRLESALKVERAPEVSTYLRELCMTLKAGASELKSVPLAVMIIRDRDTHWRNYALPGVRVYLSSRMLQAMSYENELAAAVALELGLLRRKAAIENLGKTLPIDDPARGMQDLSKAELNFFGPSGILTFSDEQLLQALPSAIELMYLAGFDLRGMGTLLSRYEVAPAASPYEMATVTKLLEKTREVIAQYAPLRNPIVRSARFIAIRKKLQKL